MELYIQPSKLTRKLIAQNQLNFEGGSKRKDGKDSGETGTETDLIKSEDSEQSYEAAVRSMKEVLSKDGSSKKTTKKDTKASAAADDLKEVPLDRQNPED